MPEDKIPEQNENARKIQYINQNNQKKMAITEVRKLYAQDTH
jgi:hypothetical protein